LLYYQTKGEENPAKTDENTDKDLTPVLEEEAQPKESRRHRLLNAGKNLIGKVSEKLTHFTDKKDLDLNEQDLRILQQDIALLEQNFPERKDILAKYKMLIRDNQRLMALLAETNLFTPHTGHLDNLLLAQIVEYEKDKQLVSKPAVQPAHHSSSQPAVASEYAFLVNSLTTSRFF